jgi:hypothetical protein
MREVIIMPDDEEKKAEDGEKEGQEEDDSDDEEKKKSGFAAALEQLKGTFKTVITQLALPTKARFELLKYMVTGKTPEFTPKDMTKYDFKGLNPSKISEDQMKSIIGVMADMNDSVVRYNGAIFPNPDGRCYANAALTQIMSDPWIIGSLLAAEPEHGYADKTPAYYVMKAVDCVKEGKDFSETEWKACCECLQLKPGGGHTLAAMHQIRDLLKAQVPAVMSGTDFLSNPEGSGIGRRLADGNAEVFAEFGGGGIPASEFGNATMPLETDTHVLSSFTIAAEMKKSGPEGGTDSHNYVVKRINAEKWQIIDDHFHGDSKPHMYNTEEMKKIVFARTREGREQNTRIELAQYTSKDPIRAAVRKNPEFEVVRKKLQGEALTSKEEATYARLLLGWDRGHKAKSVAPAASPVKPASVVPPSPDAGPSSAAPHTGELAGGSSLFSSPSIPAGAFSLPELHPPAKVL